MQAVWGGECGWAQLRAASPSTSRPAPSRLKSTLTPFLWYLTSTVVVEKVPDLEPQSSALGGWEGGGESDLLPCEEAWVGEVRGAAMGGAPSCHFDPGAPRVLKVDWACGLWGHLQLAPQVITISISPHRAPPKPFLFRMGLILKGKVIPGKRTLVDSNISRLGY